MQGPYVYAHCVVLWHTQRCSSYTEQMESFPIFLGSTLILAKDPHARHTAS